MLGCICRIHLGIQWLRIQCSGSYAQHQLGMLQKLCPIVPILIFSHASRLPTLEKGFITHVLLILLLSTNIKILMRPNPLTQHKLKITHVLQSLSLNKNIEYSCVLELLIQQKTSNTNVPQILRSTQTSHQLCASGSMPITWNHIHKTYAIRLRPIYQTNHHSYVQWGLMPNIQNKTSKQHHKQWGLFP